MIRDIYYGNQAISRLSYVSASKDGVVHFPAIPVILMKII